MSLLLVVVVVWFDFVVSFFMTFAVSHFDDFGADLIILVSLALLWLFIVSHLSLGTKTNSLTSFEDMILCCCFQMFYKFRPDAFKQNAYKFWIS